MSQLIYTGGYALSTLRSWIECGYGGFTTASSMRAAFAGYGSTGAMSFATHNYINTRCWNFGVDAGSGTVAITSPWSSGYSTYHAIPQSYAVTANNNLWVTINASPSSSWSFSYWMRDAPNEIWSYSANTSYYVPTAGWGSTTYIGAVFSYSPPPPSCYNYNLYAYEYYAGYICGGGYQSGYTYGYGVTGCFSSLDYGGDNTYQACMDPNCLVKGTSIEMADGTHKLIEKIRVGDVLKGMKINDAPEDDTIHGWSTDDLNLVETSVVVQSIIPIACTKTYIFNDGLIESSPEHAHFIQRGDVWKFEQARNLQVGDFLVDKQGNSVEIISIEFYQHVEATETDPGKPRKIIYDMNVETTDTYIANGLITHNPMEKLAPA
jgi:hypothetical protein